MHRSYFVFDEKFTTKNLLMKPQAPRGKNGKNRTEAPPAASALPPGNTVSSPTAFMLDDDLLLRPDQPKAIPNPPNASNSNVSAPSSTDLNRTARRSTGTQQDVADAVGEARAKAKLEQEERKRAQDLTQKQLEEKLSAMRNATSPNDWLREEKHKDLTAHYEPRTVSELKSLGITLPAGVVDTDVMLYDFVCKKPVLAWKDAHELRRHMQGTARKQNPAPTSTFTATATSVSPNSKENGKEQSPSLTGRRVVYAMTLSGVKPNQMSIILRTLGINSVDDLTGLLDRNLDALCDSTACALLKEFRRRNLCASADAGTQAILGLPLLLLNISVRRNVFSLLPGALAAGDTMDAAKLGVS